MRPIKNLYNQGIIKQVIGGDFNARSTLWGDRIDNSEGKELRNWIEEHNLILMTSNQGPTFRAVRASVVNESSVDFIMASEEIAAKAIDITTQIDLNLSDHLPRAVMLKSKLSLQEREKSTRIYSKKQSPESYAQFTEALEYQSFNVPTWNQSVDRQVADLTLRIHIAAAGNLQRNKPGSQVPDLPWWDDEIQEQVKAIRRIKKFIKNGTPNSRLHKANLVEKIKLKLKNMIEKKKKFYFRQQFSVENPADVWDKFYQRLCKKMSSDAAYLMDNGIRIDDKKIILQRLAEKFFSLDDPSIDNEDHKNLRLAWNEPYETPLETEEIEPTKEEVETAIRSFSSGKSPGDDGITHEMISSMGENAVNAFHQLILNIWRTKKFPTQWKIARIVFLMKPGAAKGTLKQFRPIGLSSCLSKILERILHSRIDYSRRQNIDPLVLERQFGFSVGVSAEDAILALVKFIESKRKEGLKVISAFVDVSSAFDFAWWYLVIKRLKKMKCEKTIVELIKSYFTDRKVELSLGNETIKVDQTRGCIQGSVLGPLFWNCHVDELFEMLGITKVRGQAFADDIVITAYGKTYEDAAKSLQTALNVVQRWARYCRLTISSEKSFVIMFGSQERSRKVDLVLDGESIKEVESTRYLGVEIDKYLTWIPHFKIQAKKVSDMYQQFAPMVTRAYGPSPEAMRLIIEGAVVPKITYGSPVIVDAVKKPTVQKLLRKVHRQWLIRAYRLFCTTSYVKALTITSSRSFEEQIIVRSQIAELRRKREVVEDIFHRYPIDVRRAKPSLPPHIKQKIQLYIESGIPSSNSNEIIAYTDGSKIDGKVRAALIVFSGDAEIYRQKIKLAEWCSVFQAEALAVFKALQFIETKIASGQSIRICSDSTSTLLAIKGDKKTFEIIWNTRKLAWDLIKNGHRISFQWVRAHVGHPLNEEVDRLAKEAALEDNVICSYNNVPFSFEKRKVMLASETRQDEWIRSERPEFIRRFGSSIWNKNVYMLSFSKEVSWLLTGHGPFKSHLKRIGVMNNDQCPCGLGIQNFEHLFDCPAFVNRWRCNTTVERIFKIADSKFVIEYIRSKELIDVVASQLLKQLKFINFSLQS